MMEKWLNNLYGRNPFVNQVSFFKRIFFDDPYEGIGRNPFVNQVSFFV